MRFARFVWLFVLFAITTALAQTNPVPLVNQPLIPDATAPGGPTFTLTVNGTGFVTGSLVYWNGTALGTTFVNSSQLTATVPASNIATASTATITVSSPSPGGGTSNVQYFSVSAVTNLQFTSVPIPANPSLCDNGPFFCGNFIVADLTADGKLDLTFDELGTEGSGDFVAGAFTSLGNGDATFQPLIASGAPFNYSIVADFNGDGKLDMAGIVQGSNPPAIPYIASIVLGNGDGTFSGGSVIATGNANGRRICFQVVAGDFNGDGKVDVAIGDGLGIEVYLGNGDGTFQAGLPPVGGGSGLEQVVGDFNGDGKLDIAEMVGSYSNPSLQILLGNGDGTFQVGASYPGLVPYEQQMFTADLNGDDKLDLIILQPAASGGTGTMTVLLGNGDGTFGTPTNYPVSAYPSGGALADLNADGKLDVALDTGNYSAGSTTIMLGNGDGTFQSPAVIPFSASLDAGDFNNDGKMDLLGYGNNGLFLLAQQVPLATLAPSTTVPFGNQIIGTTSPASLVMLSNQGTAVLTVTSMSITGADPNDFAFKSLCGPTPTIPINGHCQINVTFTPTTTGNRSAAFTVVSNGIGSPTSVGLTGTGINPPPLPYLSPTSVNFPSQYVGTSGLPQSVTLTNPASTALVISNVTATPADFAPLSTCGNQVAPGGSCSIGVFFDPTTSGTRSGTLTVTDNATNSPQTASLTGTGQDFSLAPGSPILGHRLTRPVSQL